MRTGKKKYFFVCVERDQQRGVVYVMPKKTSLWL